MLVRLLPQQRRNASRRRQLSHPSQRDGLSAHALRAAEPVDRDAQLGKRLLEHPILAGRAALHEHDAAGDAPGERAEPRSFVGADPTARSEIREQRLRLFDVEAVAGRHAGRCRAARG